MTQEDLKKKSKYPENNKYALIEIYTLIGQQLRTEFIN